MSYDNKKERKSINKSRVVKNPRPKLIDDLGENQTNVIRVSYISLDSLYTIQKGLKVPLSWDW